MPVSVANDHPEIGDTHNFGRYTQKLVGVEKNLYLKHRCLFWEWLLLDQTSPIKDLLDPLMPKAFIDSTFGLKVHRPFEPNKGTVEEVIGKKNLSDIVRNEVICFNVGMQISYYMSLGMVDLLLENFKIVDQGLQLIDAECLFNFTTRLEQATLLPFKGTPFDGRFALFPYFYQISDPTILKGLVTGFIQGTLLLNSVREDLSRTITEEMSRFSSPVPVRVLLRPTREYDLYLTEGMHPGRAFIPEEEIQLKRGDVPYFFKFVGGSSIHFYADKDFNCSEVNPATISEHPETATFVRPIQDLLVPERLILALLRNGVSSLARWTNWGVKHDLTFQNSVVSLSIKDRHANIRFKTEPAISFPF